MRRPIAYGLSLVSAASATLALAPAGFASSGGGGLTPSSANPAPPAAPGNVMVSASAGGMSLESRASAILRSQLQVSGSASTSQSGQTVQIERLGRETHYRAQPKGLAPMVNWMSRYRDFWCDRFDRLEKLLERMDQ